MTSASTSPPVVVFGATGYVGSNLVPRLMADGVHVRAVGRQPRVIEARGWEGVEVVEADALEPATLDAALAGASTAYYLVHSMAAGRDFGRLDREAAANFAQAAARAGVQRIVYLGGLVPKAAESEHLVSRKESGDMLRAGRVPVTEIRAGIIVGPGSAAYEVMRDLVYHLPVMVTPKWVQSRSSPIALENLLEYLVRVAALPETAGGIYDAGGPEYMSYEEMMLAFGEVVGRRTRIIRVPVLSPRLSSYWLGLVTAVPASIAGALIGGLKHDIPADDAALRRMVPQQLLTFRESVVAALQAERDQQVTVRWTEGAFPYRAFRHDYAFYAKKASGTATAAASPASVWKVVTAIGGDNRYYTMAFLWWLRELLDWLVGGPGFTHGRRHPTDLRVGDAIDYWTVIGMERERRLTLNFGMRAPGAGILEFEIEPAADGRTRVTVTAYWHPQGVWGLLYWYALVPAHLFIFDRMTQAIARRAEALDATAERPAPSL
ncbi:MAG: SDR family oxidoreductase [Burkholderiaceae bacterium]